VLCDLRGSIEPATLETLSGLNEIFSLLMFFYPYIPRGLESFKENLEFYQ
jgi:hypothetical protein